MKNVSRNGLVLFLCVLVSIVMFGPTNQVGRASAASVMSTGTPTSTPNPHVPYLFSQMWGIPGDGTVLSPSGLAVAASGAIYVADNQANQIVKFDSAGHFVSRWGGPGTGNGQFDLRGMIVGDIN